MPATPARRILFPLALALAALAGCEEAEEETPVTAPTPSAPRPKIKSLAEKMRDPSQDVRNNARAQLFNLAAAGLAPKDGVRLLIEAAEPVPKGLESIRPDFVRAAARLPSPDAVPFVEELFPRYDRETKAEALGLLANLPGRDAATAYLRLVLQSPPSENLPIGTLAEEPRHADILFPKLLDLAGIPELLPGVCRVATAYAEQGLLTAETLRPLADRLAEPLVAKVELLEGRSLFRPKPEVVEGWRSLAIALLDLVAHAPTPRIAEVARRALGVDDRKVKAHALISLLKQGEMVEAETAATVAADPRVRLWLRAQLQDLDRMDLYPEAFRTQEAIAEGEFAQSLAGPDGDLPDVEAIRYEGTQTAWTARGAARQFYLFRFRLAEPDARARRGWMAGWVSYPPNVQPSPTTGGLCGTNFTPYDNLTPEGHIAQAARNNVATPGMIEDDEPDD